MPPRPSWYMAHHSDFQENLCCKAPQTPLPHQRHYNTCREQCLAFNIHQLHDMARDLCMSHEHYNRWNMCMSVKTRRTWHSPYNGPYKVLECKDKTLIIEQGDKHDTASIDRLKLAYLGPRPDSLHTGPQAPGSTSLGSVWRGLCSKTNHVTEQA